MLTRRAEAELRHGSGREEAAVVRWGEAEGEERNRLRQGKDSNEGVGTRLKARAEMQELEEV